MKKPIVGIVMGSASDANIMRHAPELLERFEIPHESKIVSAHRTPELLYEYAKSAEKRGLQCIIAGAGGAAHLPGMLASLTTLPVLGVPIPSKYLQGIDSLYSIAQMPAGTPVATFSIGEAGAKNAALFACSLLSLRSQKISDKLTAFRKASAKAVLDSKPAYVDNATLKTPANK